jgi:hypothetical protein
MKDKPCNHRWELVKPTSNYRFCYRCDALQVCVDDHWVAPTPKRKRSSSLYAMQLKWTALAGVDYQDLQGNYTPLFGLRRDYGFHTVSKGVEA